MPVHLSLSAGKPCFHSLWQATPAEPAHMQGLIPPVAGHLSQHGLCPVLQEDYRAANEAKQRAGDAAQKRVAAQASQVNTAFLQGMQHWPAEHAPDMLCETVELRGRHAAEE